MTNDTDGTTRRPSARVNLRMRSDEVSFQSAAHAIALVPEIVGVNGEPRVDRKGERLSPARQNYVSFAEYRLLDASQLGFCVDAILSALAASAYAEGTTSGTVDATLWIAVFDENFAYQGAIGEASIARARGLGVRLFIEDYTRQADDGSILTIWLT